MTKRTLDPDGAKGGGWKGRISAAVIGGTVLAFAVGVFVTIYMPGFDGLDQAFMGGLVLVLAWPSIMLWVLFARSGGKAWVRVLIPFTLFLALDVGGLFL
ncbi:MAG: hypothetical protein MPN21_12380 [Thermoanaerobaculia bacterium]|nr:hypothetical protein [Thermoanaerobaculia bacterium]